MTRGAVQEAAAPDTPSPVSAGRPPWWLSVGALVATVGLTAGLLGPRTLLERIDYHVAARTAVWDLRDSGGYWPLWLVTQLGGRVFLLVVLAVLVGYLAVQRRTLLPLVRVLLALALLTLVVYGFKYGAGRTPPAFGVSSFHEGGTSFPSGHVANAVLMWGVARWQAVEYRLPTPTQRLFWFLSVAGPAAAGAAMIALDFHWLTDAVVGATVGIVLLGVVHLLDAVVLSRWVRARTGRPRA